MKKIVIAIDGHSSTGKSTVAKRLAEYLQFVYIDSGAMYRAVTFFAIQSHCFKNDKLNNTALLEKLHDIDIDFQFNNKTQKSRILLNGKNVEDNIRGMSVSERVSQIATIPEVRKKLVTLQRDMAHKHNIVMDGRDIGSVVFPEADIKFFMTASAEGRAKRRFEELQQKGETTSFNEVFENIQNRDQIDTTRKHSPLIKAENAIVIDNTNLSEDEQFKIMLKTVSDYLS
ncbi:(d)CMP kinase [Mesohalobacter halotolerans]|uniref:Cytidylate kinase n=1 Tax=Mesohalobacter halotolerans TaxID=1883405 RepID=A0A4U5TQ97_9FLAO|nr:(d)CMP kinase [Mesohalobacter halotolerans]MBS3739373.1 (d)CMP kinase [Psychroflexus sp.]TKS56359.1 (d)CMP kinase [Mesohalobacter halotolerans]